MVPLTSGHSATDVRAAGAVVTRRGGEVLLVHRPRYDDWSFPKGKLDHGEHVVSCAVREVAEETGLAIRLGVPLAGQRYRLAGGRTKAVSWWMGRVVGSDDVSRYQRNDEVDDVRWVTWDKAERMLTHEVDRTTLAEARTARRKTRAVVVLRHGHALSRKKWQEDDRRRPLLASGAAEAQLLVPMLAAYGVQRVVTSSSVRCVDTVAPYADQAGREVEPTPVLSEEGADPAALGDLVAALVAGRQGAVVCSHRPVLPTLLEALGVRPARLEPGEMLVVHHRKGRVAGTERHVAR